MSKVSFCRRVHFTAAHHYARTGCDEIANRQLFGDSAVPHEHDWTVTVWFQGPLNQDGMVIDLCEVDAALHELFVQPYHRQHLNAVDPYFQTHQPTNEVLAAYFADKLQTRFHDKMLVKLRVAEHPDLFAEWTP